jgi:hypothetical protein
VATETRPEVERVQRRRSRTWTVVVACALLASGFLSGSATVGASAAAVSGMHVPRWRFHSPVASPKAHHVRSLPRSVSFKATAGSDAVVVLARVVTASRLPKPTPPTKSQPDEGTPVPGPPRTTGIIQLHLTKGTLGHATAGRARPRITSHFSLAGLSGGGPPDTQIAASRSFVVEFVNREAIVYTQKGNSLLTFDLGSLFAGTRGTGSDPKILYDAASGDFFASYIGTDSPHGGPSTVNLAVTSNPVGTWGVYRVRHEGLLMDQPKLGVSTHTITMSWNVKHGAAEMMVIQKSGLVAYHSSVAASFFAPNTSLFNPIPAIQTSPSSTDSFAVAHLRKASTIDLLKFTGVPPATTSYTKSVFTIAPTGGPPESVQPPAAGGGPSDLLPSGGDRLESAWWYRGDLWTAAGDSCQYTTDTAARACLRVIQISTSPLKLLQDVDLTMVGGDVLFPALALDANKDLWLSFTSTSSSQFASSEVAEVAGGRIGTSVPGFVYYGGSGAVSGCPTSTLRSGALRWGDYSGITLDPSSKLGIWAATEYGKAGCSHGTQLGSVTP